MADVRKTITIAVNDEFSSSLRSLVTQLNQAERAAQTAGQSGAQSGNRWRQFGQDLFFAGNAASMAWNAIKQGYQIIDEFVQIGNESRRANIALEGLFGGSTAQANAWKDAIVGATHGTITEMQAAQFAYQEYNLGLAKTAEQAAEFTRVAAIIGAASPQLGDTAEAISQISLTLANTSYLRLDQLGISSAVVREKVAALREETKGLSEQEAFQTVVMGELTAKANLLGDEMLTASDATERLKTRWHDLKAEIGEGISATVEVVATAVEDYADYASGGDYQKGESYRQLVASGQYANYDQYAPLGWDLRPQRYQESLQSQIANAAYWRSAGAEGQSMLYPFMDSGTSEADMRALLDSAPLRTQRRQWDWSAYYASQQESRQYAVDHPQMGSREADSMGEISAKAQLLKDIMKDTEAATEGVAKWGRDAAASFKDTAAAVAETEITFSSLSERFGTGQSGYDASVGGAMGDAMQTAGLNQEQMNAALEVYNVLTGEANSQSLIYEGMMAGLAEKFQTGTLSAEEYARAVMDLNNMDFSWASNLDTALARGNIGFDYYNQQIQNAAANGPTWSEAGQAAGGQMGGGWAGGGFGGAPGQESGVPITPQAPEVYVGSLALDTEEAMGQIADFRSSIDDISATSVPNITTAFDDAAAALPGTLDDMSTQISDFAAQFQTLPDASINVGVNVAPPHGSIWINWGTEGSGETQTPVGSGSLSAQHGTPWRAGGGQVSLGGIYGIGDTNTPEVLQQGGRSYLLPGANGRIAPLDSIQGGGGSGTPAQIQVQVMLNEREVGRAVVNTVVPDRSGSNLAMRDEYR